MGQFFFRPQLNFYEARWLNIPEDLSSIALELNPERINVSENILSWIRHYNSKTTEKSGSITKSVGEMGFVRVKLHDGENDKAFEKQY